MAAQSLEDARFLLELECLAVDDVLVYARLRAVLECREGLVAELGEVSACPLARVWEQVAKEGCGAAEGGLSKSQFWHQLSAWGENQY